MNCISECQCKSLRSLILQIRDVRYPPCTSASLTLRVSEVSYDALFTYPCPETS